eukprot:scaffold194238_cov16-Prasinocladus_malaysianus.AAC.1
MEDLSTCRGKIPWNSWLSFNECRNTNCSLSCWVGWACPICQGLKGFSHWAQQVIYLDVHSCK